MIADDVPLPIVGSSVIFLVIIGLWAVFLVPHLVRHRADLGSSRARDRFSTAMRVLGRRHAAPRTPSRGGRGYLHRPRPASRGVNSPSPHASPARRRAPVAGLAVLALLVPVVLAVPAAVVAAVLGAVPGWVAPLPAGTLLALLAVLRARAVRRRRSRAAARRPATVAVVTPPAVETEPAPADVPPAQAPVPATSTADDGTWTPVPVPPPTYTLKPPAPRRAPAPEPAAASAAPTPAPVAWDLDEVLERRRAAAG